MPHVGNESVHVVVSHFFFFSAHNYRKTTTTTTETETSIREENGIGHFFDKFSNLRSIVLIGIWTFEFNYMSAGKIFVPNEFESKLRRENENKRTKFICTQSAFNDDKHDFE